MPSKITNTPILFGSMPSFTKFIMFSVILDKVLLKVDLSSSDMHTHIAISRLFVESLLIKLIKLS